MSTAAAAELNPKQKTALERMGRQHWLPERLVEPTGFVLRGWRYGEGTDRRADRHHAGAQKFIISFSKIARHR